MSSSNEDEDEQNNTPVKSGPQTEITQDSIERNNTPDKKNKCMSLLDKYTSLRCLGIWVTVITLLFLTASVVCGIFLIGYIQTMQTSLDDLQNQLTDQQKKTSSLQQQLKGQKQINNDLLENVTNQQLTISYQTANISSQSATISQLQQEMSALQHKTDTDVFFAAKPTYSSWTVQTGKTVIYDYVIISVGGGYDSSTGIFHAPKYGYYRAYINALAEENKRVTLTLKHNGVSVVFLWCDEDGGESSCSNSAIVRLNKGDTLQVVAGRASCLGTYESNNFSVQLMSVV